MTPDDRIWRGNEAKRLLDEPLLKEAFDAVERDTVNELKRMPIWEADRKRRDLVHRLQLLEDVRQHLQAVIAAGKQVAARMED